MAEEADALPRYVLDTSALLAYIEDEDGSELVESLLERAERREAILLVSFITYAEILYITLREQGEETAHDRLELLSQLPLIRVESDTAIGLAAGQLKATYPISLADCWVAALGELYEAKLVHKDPEFEVLAERIELMPLPYKRGDTT